MCPSPPLIQARSQRSAFRTNQYQSVPSHMLANRVYDHLLVVIMLRHSTSAAQLAGSIAIFNGWGPS